MKQLKCEMCGSTDLIKQDGMFVCQVCGTKYSVEEAKKMMIEGRVEVQGTVKIDISDELSKLYKTARSARDDGNVEDAIRCYNDILRKDPASWEAAFYVCFINACHCKLGEVESAATRVSTCTKSVLRLIKDNVESKEEQIAAVNEIAERCTAISELLFTFAKKYTGGTYMIAAAQYNQQNINGCCAARDIMYVLGDTVKIIFGDYPELYSVSVKAWESGIAKHNILMPLFSKKDLNKAMISQYESKIQEIKDAIAAKQAAEETARRDAYWEKHKEEKEKLDKELSQLQEAKKQYADQIAELQKQRKFAHYRNTQNELQNKIVSLTEQKKALGLFKIKEKKTLQDQIDGLEKEKAATIEQIRNEQYEIEKEIEPIKKELDNVVAKINKIETELTKDR